MTPNMMAGIPITGVIPNAPEPSPIRAVMTPEIRITDPVRYFQKRNCLLPTNIAERRL